jgi:uncharacterized protein YdiU (UPF0061 family)
MNTDNSSISGETIDYGPCAFMDDYDPRQVFSSIDEMGRYAYANQPRIALWNLTRLAECLLPLFADDKDKAIEQAQFILGEFAEKFTTAYQTDPTAFTEWAVRWRQRITAEPQSPAERHAAMRAVNPAFIPRNHRVEAVIQAALNNDDYAPFEELLAVLAKPFDDQPEIAAYADPPQPEQRVTQTFCGT